MKLIIINGSTCSGKSTVIKGVLKQQERYFHLSYDALKWSFSKYKSDIYYEDVQRIVLAVAREVIDMGYNIISDSGLYRASRDKLIKLALSFNYEVSEINLEADFEVLSQRFTERVESALANPNSRIANTSKDRFKELFDIYNQEKNTSAITFRTDINQVDDILEKISKFL